VEPHISGLEIGALEVAELPDALALQKMAFMTEAVLYDNPFLAALEETFSDIRCEFSSKTFLAAHLESRLVGVVRGHVRNGVGIIERLVVHPGYRGHGIGGALVHALEQHLNTSSYTLFTGAKSAANIRLYERLGYRVTRTQTTDAGTPLVHLEKP
jgi:GNAT superfamily N-acetyltransferase